MSIDGTGHRGYKWCPVCEGRGGWDKQSSVPRDRVARDNRDTYLNCIWCGTGNVIRPTIDRVK